MGVVGWLGLLLDYNVSFTEEQKAQGKVFYNFEERDWMSDELPGFSVFTRDETGQIFHTYWVFARGTGMSARSMASSASPPRAATSRTAESLPLGPPPRQI